MLEHPQRGKAEEEIGDQLREAAQEVEPAFSEVRHQRIMQLIHRHDTKPSERSAGPQRRRVQRWQVAGMAALVALFVAMFFSFSPFSQSHTNRPTKLTFSPPTKALTNQSSGTRPSKPIQPDDEFRISDGIQLVFDLLHTPIQPQRREPSRATDPLKQNDAKSPKLSDAKKEVVLLNRFAGNWTLRLTP